MRQHHSLYNSQRTALAFAGPVVQLRRQQILQLGSIRSRAYTSLVTFRSVVHLPDHLPCFFLSMD